MGWFLRHVGIAVALSTTGCVLDNNLQALDIPAGCNPIASEHDCLLPYPSDAFRSDGVIEIDSVALTLYESNTVVDPFTAYRPTGFSVGNQILALFPQAVDDTALVGPRDDFTPRSRTKAPR